MKMGRLSEVILVALCVQIAMLVGLSNGEDSNTKLTQECTKQIQNLGNCLMYVTGKDANPTKPCCNTIDDIKNQQPVCLCFFIGQAHNGTNPAIKNLGIQESRLLQLPDACHLANASLTNCPKLLGISPSSPAAAIFMNSSNATSVPASNDPTSDGLKLHGNGPLLIASLVVAVLITIIPIATLEI